MRVMGKKKGQAALEYLVTYGWAILAIVIVAAVLWYLGIFNPQKYVGNKQCGGFSSLVCRDYTATGGSVIISFGNAVGGPITVSTTGCTTGSIPANGNFNCTSSATTTSGLDIPITVAYTDTTSGLAHSETGFVRGQG